MKKSFLILTGTFAMAVFAIGGAYADIDIVQIGSMAAMGEPDALMMFGMAGMIVNKAALNNVFTGLKTLFNNALTAQTGNWQLTAMEVPSTSSEEDYVWLERFPMMRKWLGEKFVKNLKARRYTAKNEDWETTIAVKRNDIEDDKLGVYNAQAQMAGASAAELHDIIVDDLKNNSFTNLGIDGQPFYDTDHEVAGASVSNKLTVALTAATAAGALASYGAARIAIMKMKDEEGMPLRLVPDLLEVPPALESVGKKLLEADKLDDDSPNPFKGTAKLFVNPGLTSDTAWFLHVTSKPVKPFIVQMRKKPVFVSQTDMENDDVFMKGEYKYGAEARATGVYGFWQTSFGSTGAG
jgi:phage major head subunit gpT-like protein